MKGKPQTVQDEFLDTFANRIGKPRAEVELWWKLFCNYAFERLVIHELPVDMGFAILHLSPFRVNWKHLVWEDLAQIYRKRKPGQAKKLLAHPRYLAFSSEYRKWYFRQYVEVEYTEAWFRNIERVHRARVKRRKLQGYVKDTMAKIEARTGLFAKIYDQWLEEGLYPSGGFHKGGYPRGSRVVRGRAATLHDSLISPGESPVNPGGPSLSSLGSAAEAVPQKDGRVPAVPAVQPQAQDVRNGGADVPQSQDRTAGADGMPVRDAGEGDVSR